MAGYTPEGVIAMTMLPLMEFTAAAGMTGGVLFQ